MAKTRSPLKQRCVGDFKVKLKVRHLPQDLLTLGQDMFFTYYVSDFSRTWDFLYNYLDPRFTPKYLTLSIEAVSLAFLSHQVSSETAKDLGRRKYCQALREINIALQDPTTAKATSTFEGALLLDLFEKIMKSALEINTSGHAHIEGALTLVKLRGVDSFKEGTELRALMGLSLNATICSLSTGRVVDPSIRKIRVHAAQFVNTDYPKWKLSGLMLDITDLAAEMRKGFMTAEERITKSEYFDRKLEIVAFEASPAWTYERKSLSDPDGARLVPAGFPRVYDVYPDRMITQMWNVLRIARILLCEEIIQSCSESCDPEVAAQCDRANTAILTLVQEIVASVPQMTDCDLVAKDKLPIGSTGKQHAHSIPHILDVYILIFSLYVVAWSRSCPQSAVDWSLKHLQHIADHFAIKEAAVILNILRKQKREERIDPWYVCISFIRSQHGESKHLRLHKKVWSAYPRDISRGSRRWKAVLNTLKERLSDPRDDFFTEKNACDIGAFRFADMGESKDLIHQTHPRLVPTSL